MLDYEFKKMKPGKLLVKQVREVPLPDERPTLTPFLVDDPVALCISQGEQSDVFALHRLKSRITLSTASRWLDAAGLSRSFYDDATLEYLSGGAPATLMGSPAGWPGATHAFSDGSATDTFLDGSGALARTITLSTSSVPTALPPSQGPVVALRDFRLTVEATYATPVPVLDWDGSSGTRTHERAQLGPCTDDGPVAPGATLQTRALQSSGGVSVQAKFYWPPAPRGYPVGYTAPLIRWVETRIEGLATEPIVLTGYFSQTYRPHHHNFGEDFLFEPALEEGLPAAVRAELEAKGIRQIFVSGSPENATFMTLNVDGEFHPL